MSWVEGRLRGETPRGDSEEKRRRLSSWVPLAHNDKTRNQHDLVPHSTPSYPTRPHATPPAESPRAGELKRHQRPRVAPRPSRAERKGRPSGGRIRPPSRLSCPSPETDERRDGNISAVIFTRIHSVRIPWGPVTSLRGLPESYSFPEGENAGIALVPV